MNDAVQISDTFTKSLKQKYFLASEKNAQRFHLNNQKLTNAAWCKFTYI